MPERRVSEANYTLQPGTGGKAQQTWVNGTCTSFCGIAPQKITGCLIDSPDARRGRMTGIWLLLPSFSSDFICEVIWMPRQIRHLFRLGRLETGSADDQAVVRRPHYCEVSALGQ